MSDAAPRPLTLSLISHTNVGKTTLARTLLRRDVGAVSDQAHVTDESEAHVLFAGDGAGPVLLWDTPGFGDSMRLLRRLRGERQPVEWLLGQVWDRFADRPLWCSQQAVKNVRDEADLVLYLVNAAEEPAMAGYVDPEMEILEWIGRPVIVLLNQTGEPRGPAAERAAIDRWRAHLARWSVVRDVRALDAFTRCWVQEGDLLVQIRDLLPAERRPQMDAVLAAWRAESQRIFAAATARLAALVAAAAADRESLARDAWGTVERPRAAEALAERLEREVRAATNALIELHGLAGEAAVRLRGRLEDVTAPEEAADPWRMGLLGGLAGGALGGLAADVATGGLSFGAGTVAGALLGAMGLGGLAWGYRQLGDEEARVSWSPDLLDRLVRDALLRYLAVAHAGHGGGEFRERGSPDLPEAEQRDGGERASPDFWRAAAGAAVAACAATLHALWAAAPAGEPAAARDAARAQLEPLVAELARELLRAFYPSVDAHLGTR